MCWARVSRINKNINDTEETVRKGERERVSENMNNKNVKPYDRRTQWRSVFIIIWPIFHVTAPNVFDLLRIVTSSEKSLNLIANNRVFHEWTRKKNAILYETYEEIIYLNFFPLTLSFSLEYNTFLPINCAQINIIKTDYRVYVTFFSSDERWNLYVFLGCIKPRRIERLENCTRGVHKSHYT